MSKDPFLTVVALGNSTARISQTQGKGTSDCITVVILIPVDILDAYSYFILICSKLLFFFLGWGGFVLICVCYSTGSNFQNYILKSPTLGDKSPEDQRKFCGAVICQGQKMPAEMLLQFPEVLHIFAHYVFKGTAQPQVS